MPNIGAAQPLPLPDHDEVTESGFVEKSYSCSQFSCLGRTGRAGRRGHAVTYFTEDDLNYIRPIANVIRQAGFEVPEYVLKMRIPTRSFYWAVIIISFVICFRETFLLHCLKRTFLS